MNLERPGAYAIRGPTETVDPTFWRRLHLHVQDAALRQKRAGTRHGEVERSVIRGVYDWRAYLREALNAWHPEADA